MADRWATVRVCDGETTTLRPLVDLNCRHSVNDGAHRLWTRLLPERTVFYRFYNRRKVDLPDEQASAVGALGERRYDPERRSGVLFASPLTLGSGAERWSSSKLAVLFAGPDRETVLDLDLWFRARFET